MGTEAEHLVVQVGTAESSDWVMTEEVEVSSIITVGDGDDETFSAEVPDGIVQPRIMA